MGASREQEPHVGRADGLQLLFCAVPSAAEDCRLLARQAALPLYRCKKEDVCVSQMPGEPRLAWQEEYDGEENVVEIPGKTIATVVFPIRKEAN